VSAKCLKKDVPLVISLIAEQLRTPALSAEEFAKAKKQYAGSLKRSLENTDFRAADAFTRAVYPIGHPNRQTPADDMLAAIESAKLEDVVAFHKKYYGPDHLTLVVVGDLDIPQIQKELTSAFAGWTGGAALIRPAKASQTDAAKDQNVFMADKTSVSVVLGQASGLKYNDPDYQALRVGTAILGSGFTGRLMANVRDKEGLTYGIGSSLARDTFSDGDWKITATFAPALLEKGLASTQRQLKSWYEAGATDTEVERRKSNLVGSFKVGLATTDGLAGAMLSAVHRGYDLTWLDEYPGKINALTPADVNAAIKKHLKPENMILIKAGTVPGAPAK
jgi:zinc protease